MHIPDEVSKNISILGREFQETRVHKNTKNTGKSTKHIRRIVVVVFVVVVCLATGMWVCPNYDMVMLQTQTVTPTYLGSVINCYVRYSTLLKLILPSPPSA